MPTNNHLRSPVDSASSWLGRNGFALPALALSGLLVVSACDPSVSGHADAGIEPSPDARLTPLTPDDFVFPEATPSDCVGTLTASAKAQALVQEQARPFALLADASNLYWLNREFEDDLGNTVSGNLMKYDLQTQATTILATGLLGPHSLNQDQANLYWTDDDGSVKRIAKGGGPIDVVLAGPGSYTRLTVSGGYVVWFDEASKQIMSADTSDFVGHALGSGGPGPSRTPSIAVAHGRAIWTTQTSENKGTVSFAPVDGSASAATRALDMWHDSDTRSLQVEGNYAYWIVDTLGDDDFIKRMDLNSGVVVNLAKLNWPEVGLRVENLRVTRHGLLVAVTSLTQTALRVYAKSPSIEFTAVVEGMPATNIVSIATTCEKAFVTGYATTGDTTTKSVYEVGLVDASGS